MTTQILRHEHGTQDNVVVATFIHPKKVMVPDGVMQLLKLDKNNPDIVYFDDQKNILSIEEVQKFLAYAGCRRTWF